ncbi:nuclear transport factor 2 (NTF2) family protein [Actinidia rufa]|uniref:Nuclear transport factor 2 (NTF2) family protein n=1 Tax=Actinidia rufa TaxID=165716 RepID=A0A7J0E752_9ERIC|nr:nuclear transport factor 2 (NTF2) family protein [Actinidia rufa]
MVEHLLLFAFLQHPPYVVACEGSHAEWDGLEGEKKPLPSIEEYQNTKYSLLWKASRSRSFKPCQVKSEDTEGTLSGERVILDEQTLERELQAAIAEENYARAAKIRDNLRVLQEDGKASVLAANSRFYNSFRNGDLAAMQALWAKGENVCVVHPGVSGISGYDLVMGSWEFVWADYEFPLDIEIKDVQVHVRGDLGYVTCTEMVKTKGRSWGRQFATNVFEKIEGQWFICIHHASNVDF